MRGRPRLLPIMIFSATCLLSIKVIDLTEGVFVRVPTVGVGQSIAAADPADEAGDAGSDQVAPADGPDDDSAAMGEPSYPVTLALGDEPDYVTPPLPLGDTAFDALGGDSRVYTPEELAVLQALGERRSALDAREQTLDARERQLAAAEQRIDEKIAEMSALQQRIEELLVAYDDQQEDEIMSLVKIYETMKPKDAAPIFETLEMEILLEIISRMSNIRSAPILARMDPVRAQEVTELLAERLQQRPDFMAMPAGQ